MGSGLGVGSAPSGESLREARAPLLSCFLRCLFIYFEGMRGRVRGRAREREGKRERISTRLPTERGARVGSHDPEVMT